MKGLRQIPDLAPYKKGDVMVVFGELFSRGYANGIVDEAEKRGMTVVHSTVGRRDADGQLRALNGDELKDKPKPFINIPLEAGFDMEPDSDGVSPCDQLKGIKMSDWDQDHLNWESVLDSQKRGIERFRSHTQSYMEELKKHIPQGANVLFVHTMAGGVPRAKIIMPVMNKVFKGRGDRFIPSQQLFESQLGRFSQLNFTEVTANTLRHLIELSQPIRESVQAWDGRVSYVAYGYHGTEILVDDEYCWQTYTPYFQGWAKMELENIAKDSFDQGIKCCVFNCPEILTNSSSIFQGVEVSLYPLIGAIQKEAQHSQYAQKVLDSCREKLKPEHNFNEIMDFTSQYVKNPLTLKFSDYAQWPQHNAVEQMAYMLDSSEHLIGMHKDPKDLMTLPLSEEVFKATGYLMFHTSWNINDPVLWLNHDIVAKQMALHP
jgi:hypothetical protein